MHIPCQLEQFWGEYVPVIAKGWCYKSHNGWQYGKPLLSTLSLLWTNFISHLCNLQLTRCYTAMVHDTVQWAWRENSVYLIMQWTKTHYNELFTICLLSIIQKSHLLQNHLLKRKTPLVTTSGYTPQIAWTLRSHHLWSLKTELWIRNQVLVGRWTFTRA